jgi:hypothetical protein
MKLWEVVAENLNAGAGGTAVGNAGPETIMLKPPSRTRHRPLPQIGYRIRVGRRTIPTPGYPADDAGGVINSAIGG